MCGGVDGACCRRHRQGIVAMWCPPGAFHVVDGGVGRAATARAGYMPDWLCGAGVYTSGAPLERTLITLHGDAENGSHQRMHGTQVCRAGVAT